MSTMDTENAIERAEQRCAHCVNFIFCAVWLNQAKIIPGVIKYVQSSGRMLNKKKLHT